MFKVDEVVKNSVAKDKIVRLGLQLNEVKIALKCLYTFLIDSRFLVSMGTQFYRLEFRGKARTDKKFLHPA